MMTNCPKCGGAVKPEAKFCPRCAFNLAQAAQQQAAQQQAPQQQAPHQQAPQQQAPQPPVERTPERVPESFAPPPQQAPRQKESAPAAQQAASTNVDESATVKSCPNCRAPVKPNQKFCMQCAAPLAPGAHGGPAQAGIAQPQAAPMAAQPPMRAPQPGPQHPGPKASSSNMKIIVIALVALVVLAGAGVGSYFLFFKGNGAETANANTQGNRNATTDNVNRQGPNPPVRGATTPDEAARMTLQAIKDGDSAALKGLSAKSKPGLADEIMAEIGRKKEQNGEVKSYRIINTFPGENSAWVAFIIQYANGVSTGRMDMVKEDGSWKVEAITQT